MLPKKYRLLSDYDFRRLRSKGRRFNSSFFALVVAKAKDASSLRFGFVVSTKLDKRATVRNRLKRILREVIRERLPRFKNGFDVAFYIRSGMVRKTYAQVAAEVDYLLSKTPLI